MENNIKRQYEVIFLQYHLDKYNAKFIKVFCNNNKTIPTKVILYTAQKRKMKYQPVSGQITLCGMFSELNEGQFYLISRLLRKYRSDDNAIQEENG